MSSAVDDDVAKTVAEGREHLGSMLSAAQTHLQKVFIVFVIGFIGTFSLLRTYIWTILKADLNAHPDIVVVAITPFEVILLQAKIGLVAGMLIALPVLLYYSRDSLKERGRWPTGLPRWKAAAFVVVATLLFLGGVVYSYRLFFPIMFEFLASNAVGAGFQPTYSISMWAQFIFLLGLSFGLAAQLPLVMSSLAYLEIVPYETFRDRWKYAIVGMFVFGALFSPPDPFTQIMWAVPLVTLYGASLYLTKLVVTARRSSDQIDVVDTVTSHWNVLAGLFLVGIAAVYLFYTGGGVGFANDLLAAIDSNYRLLAAGDGFGSEIGLSSTVVIGIYGAISGMLATIVGVGYIVFDELDPEAGVAPTVGESVPDPSAIDLTELDADAIAAAPRAAFVAMSEDEAVENASRAIDNDDPELAAAILDRFDEVQSEIEADDDDGDDVSVDASLPPAHRDDEKAGAGDTEEGGILARRSAGVLNAFSEDEIDEDDVGGYGYDIAFVLDSLTSKSFRLVGLGMVVMAATFFALYAGGIGWLNDQFVRRMPDQFAASQVGIVTLHPVEALIFQIKVSVIFGAVAVVPLLLYYAWPALQERGLARGDRRVLLAWGGTMLIGILVGSIVGFIYVAPAVISWLAADVLRAEMILAYRINNFGWLIFFSTVGVGLLAMIPVTMVMFHRGNIVPYRTMRTRWREVAITVLALGAIGSPRGVFTMFLVGIPVVATYLFGLGILWVYTLGGTRNVPRSEPAN
ncbi:MAG: twin-arginine translocase subunit TatC [Natronomonas sp.]